ncbi:NADPH dehydrogenase [Sporothrix brasiliensis 5110]|uniref:NADPH dehydrogenase n=1 Tax=Sporothrix brasiliensis 5110 TaxID=1398154 RepID=A0A0C2JE00_9PEZI|nr:NADPH dehydrogenase [Sporothrix brasiliensis 5110]KIH95142.1 NADPH dehydrogenase [Sporothrix brasiliensis 5110]
MTRPTGITHRGKKTASLPAAGVPFYTPAQTPPPGTATRSTTFDGKPIPTLFTPHKIRGVEFSNRFVVSPMCMYSADDGHLTDFHLVHLGQFALNGAALTIVEATAVLPNGRISPEDSGLWQDSQIAPLKRIADFVHSQGNKIGIQLGHAGRKASTLAPWHAAQRGEKLFALESEGGWPDNTWAPSAIPYAPDWLQPHEVTLDDIQEIKASFAAAAKRAVAAGVDVVEIHAAHGYLLTQFLSPTTNKRTDQYGGSFENRTRLVLEIVRDVRAVLPDSTPLFLRVSATEWLETVTDAPSWTVEDTVKLADQLPALGVDLLDVSSGGNSRDQSIQLHPRYQIDLVPAIKKALRAQGSKAADTLQFGAVGFVRDAELAKDAVQKGGDVEADLVLAARQFLKEPEFVRRVAHKLGVPISWPTQYGRALWKPDAKI